MDAKRNFRWAHEDDFAALAEIMYDAVRNGESRYSERQREAWVPVPRGGEEWRDRLHRQEIVIAEVDGEPLGFMSLAPGGYIDFAYIRPVAQHSGLFRQLFKHIIDRAHLKGEKRLWVHASLMAEPAFSALGFTVTKREHASIGQEQFERCEMEMSL